MLTPSHTIAVSKADNSGRRRTEVLDFYGLEDRLHSCEIVAAAFFKQIIIWNIDSLAARDLKFPVLTLGTGTFGGKGELFSAWGNNGVPEATRLVDICLEAGLTMFDSADIYSDGLAEEILGQAIAGRRDQVLISTKATFRLGDGPNDVGSSRFHLIRAVEASLKRLGTDYIDLFQLHGFDAVTPIEETLSTLDDLVRAGKIRYLGCSNFSGWHLMKSLAIVGKTWLCPLRGAPGILFTDRPRL